jgi:hypothetical protein
MKFRSVGNRARLFFTLLLIGVYTISGCQGNGNTSATGSIPTIPVYQTPSPTEPTTTPYQRVASPSLPSPIPSSTDQISTSSPSLTEPSQDSSTQELVNSFIKSHVGEDYFNTHYFPVEAQDIGSNVIKASYHYTYEPYVQKFPFTLFVTADGQSLATDEITVALLESQEFVIDSAKAIDIVVKKGLGDASDEYLVTPLLNQQTHNRFAWQVVNETFVTSPESHHGQTYTIVLDVETSEVYFQEVLGGISEGF